MNSIQTLFANLIDDLKETHGTNLASVILYGSAATGDFLTSTSDYNLLIALKKITPKTLRNSQAPMREWRRLGHPLPVYFTVSELKTAADVFPIEFHQMEQARVVLYGEDVLANLTVSDDYLRHQVEYELRSKLLQLRRLYIPTCVSASNLENLMSESLTSFASIFRAVLLLQGIEPPLSKQEVVKTLVSKLQLNGEVFETIFNFRQKKISAPLDEISANQLFGDYMEQIERVIEVVDQLRQS